MTAAGLESAVWEMVTLSSVRLPVVEPRRTMRTWVAAGGQEIWLNRWTMQNPDAALVRQRPGRRLNATVNVLADAMAEAAIDVLGYVVLDAPLSSRTKCEDAVFVRRPSTSAGIPLGKGGVGAAKISPPSNVPPGRRCSRMKSVATAEALSQESLIRSMSTGVARKFTGAAGKTVAEEVSSENLGSSSSDAAPTRYMKVTPSCKPRDLSVAPAARPDPPEDRLAASSGVRSI